MNTCIISLHHFNYCMASFFIRVDVTSETVYELVAEPIQEPQAGEPQAEATAEPDPEDLVNPADLQGKPRSITPSFNIQCLLYKYLCIYVLGVVWNPSMHIIPRYLRVYTSMYMSLEMFC